jgi:cell division protein FtsB
MTAAQEDPNRGPRPFAAFLISLGISTVLLFLLLFSDRRVFELGVARARIRQLDTEIAEKERENRELKSQVEAATRHEFPAEKVAREELQMVAPADLVLLYPHGALTAQPTPPRPSSAPAR